MCISSLAYKSLKEIFRKLKSGDCELHLANGTLQFIDKTLNWHLPIDLSTKLPPQLI